MRYKPFIEQLTNKEAPSSFLPTQQELIASGVLLDPLAGLPALSPDALILGETQSQIFAALQELSQQPIPQPMWDGLPPITVSPFGGNFDVSISTAAYYKPDGIWYGTAVFAYGRPGIDIPVTGDWDGDGVTTIGIFEPDTATWKLKNTNSPGAPDIVTVFGNPGDIPAPGNYDLQHPGIEIGLIHDHTLIKATMAGVVTSPY